MERVTADELPGAPRILALPTLHAGALFSTGRGREAFPFAEPRLVTYYLARNAVWHAAQALRLSGWECLVPAYHHGVEVEALAWAGVLPRFYRVDAHMRPDLEDLERRIGTRTRAIYLIHYLGFPGPARELRELCDRRGIALVEDCALALLSRDGETPLGALGDASIFCFYKTLPIPHGGALLTTRGSPFETQETEPLPLPAAARQIASHLLGGLELRAGPTTRRAVTLLRRSARRAVAAAGVPHVGVGTQHFQPEQVRLGMATLWHRLARCLDHAAIVARRRRNYLALDDLLRDLAPPLFDALPPGVCPLFYPLRAKDKPRLRALLAARGIDTVDFWRVGHPGCEVDEFPEVAALRKEIVELPIHQDLDTENAPRLAEAVARALAECR